MNPRIHASIADDLAPLGGFLRCETCGLIEGLDQHAMATYLRSGWPRCCGCTMRWWTARQVAAGEVPDWRPEVDQP